MGDGMGGWDGGMGMLVLLLFLVGIWDTFNLRSWKKKSSFLKNGAFTQNALFVSSKNAHDFLF